MARIYRNVYGFSKAIEETAHDGHLVNLTGPMHGLDPDDPDSRGAYVRCLTCDNTTTFLAFEDEITEETD